MTKKIATTILFVLLFVISAHGQDITNINDSTQNGSISKDSIIQTLPYSERAHLRISRLLDDEMFKTSQLGLMIYDLDADTVFLAHNEKQLLRPASTMKLLTAVTALDKLGSDYRFTTKMYTTGNIEGSKLNGNIFVKGGMDPSFCEYDLNDMIDAIRQLHIDTITGALVEDRSFKDEKMLGEGWCWDDKNPTLTPLVYKRKDAFISTLRTKLDELGIVILGCDSVGNIPADASFLVQLTTSLPVILSKMLKDSDNLYAEAMLYNICASENGIATAKSAQRYEKQLISRLGLNANDYRLADGSGLSLYNYLSAELEVLLLRYAYKNRSIFETLYPALPIAGVDGTLKKRMTGTKAQNNVHAKTGTLSGISSLAGYATTPEGHTMAFCIINQGIMKGQKGKDFQDKVCEALTF